METLYERRWFIGQGSVWHEFHQSFTTKGLAEIPSGINTLWCSVLKSFNLQILKPAWQHEFLSSADIKHVLNYTEGLWNWISFYMVACHGKFFSKRHLSINGCYLTSIWISIMKIRWPHGHLICIMGMLMPEKMVFMLKWNEGFIKPFVQ